MNPEPPNESPSVDVVELHAKPARLPSVWVAFVAGLACLGAIFLWLTGGGFQSDVYDLDAASSGVDLDMSDPIAAGKDIFGIYCAICHRPTGDGVPGQFPPLAGSPWVLGAHGDNKLILILLDGLHDPVTVEGQTYNNVMVPWGQVMTDAQIAAVLSYVRQEWGNKASPISPEFVAKVRAVSGNRSDSWTERELIAVPALTAPLPTPRPSPASSAP